MGLLTRMDAGTAHQDNYRGAVLNCHHYAGNSDARSSCWQRQKKRAKPGFALLASSQ